MRSQATLLKEATAFVSVLAQCQRLGIKVVSADHNELTLELPYSQQIIGDARTGLIHGGAITTLMDTTAGTGVLCALPEFELCPTLDLRVDYLRPAQPNKSVYACAQSYRITANIVFMRCEAYQLEGDEKILVANCVATFMRMEDDKRLASIEQMTAGVNLPDFSQLPQPQASIELITAINTQNETEKHRALVNAIPYAQLIGITFEEDSEVIAQQVGSEAKGQLFRLARQASNLGNPSLPAIHGGVLGGFMELAGILHLFATIPVTATPKIIDFSLDYLRAGLDKDCFAYCEISRQGNRVINVEVQAWQSERNKPIALGRGHFLIES